MRKNSASRQRGAHPSQKQVPAPATYPPLSRQSFPDANASPKPAVSTSHHISQITILPAAATPASDTSHTLQRTPAAGAAAVEDSAAQKGGEAASGAFSGPQPDHTGLPDPLRAGVEQLSGIAMDDVQVHYNSPRPAAVGALAYAQGADIHVGPGQEQHLPHEAWHVVQQKQGRVKPTLQAKGVAINDDAGLEREADVMGERASDGYKGIQAPDTAFRSWHTMHKSSAVQMKIRVGTQVISNGQELKANPTAYQRFSGLSPDEKQRFLWALKDPLTEYDIDAAHKVDISHPFDIREYKDGPNPFSYWIKYHAKLVATSPDYKFARSRLEEMKPLGGMVTYKVDIWIADQKGQAVPYTSFVAHYHPEANATGAGSGNQSERHIKSYDARRAPFLSDHQIPQEIKDAIPTFKDVRKIHRAKKKKKP